jgi:hypothetical protein
MKILADVQVALDGVRVRYFSARELLRLRRWGVHAELPDAYLPALLRVAHAADQLRAMHGAPVVCGNGYRPIDYNKAVGGSRNSAHIRAAAMDLDPTELRSRLAGHALAPRPRRLRRPRAHRRRPPRQRG